MRQYSGSCHCQAVTFKVNLPDVVESDRCNCSICHKSGLIHVIVPLRDFILVKGEEYLTTYTFNTKIAKHTFCRVCGIKPFYTPRSNPDGVSVNLHCLDSLPATVKIADFDGQNWENNAYTLAHKSK
ncbi:GFA family protein [Glaciecola sp. SC05]|uniref:GFA family protein n=1 Tax=Glaciecola sp. SC05 TaxID=1987355 RepID=UPI003527FAD4